MVYLLNRKELLKTKINEKFTPNPFRIDIIFEEDLEVFTTIIVQRLDKKYFVYLSHWDKDFKCTDEIELTPEVLELIKKNKDLIDKVK